MRIAMMAMVCCLSLTASAIPGVREESNLGIVKELKKFQGTWTFESVVAAGKKVDIAAFNNVTVTFKGAKYFVKNNGKVFEAGTQKLYPSKTPKAFDATITVGPNKGSVLVGIYEIKGDTLRVCFVLKGKKRPTQFTSAPDSPATLVVHKRAKK